MPFILLQLTTFKLINLSERVGSYAFAFFTRGHVHNMNIPGWVASNEAILFFREVLHLDPLDVATKFEHWACARERGQSYPILLTRALSTECRSQSQPSTLCSQCVLNVHVS